MKSVFIYQKPKTMFLGTATVRACQKMSRAMESVSLDTNIVMENVSALGLRVKENVAKTHFYLVTEQSVLVFLMQKGN